MKIIGIIRNIFILVGVSLLIGSYFIYQNNKSFVSEAILTEGTVVDLQRTRSSDSNSYHYRPVVLFTIKTGESIEFISSTGSNPASYTKGEKVEVLYDPSDPQSARIKEFFSLWGTTVILGSMGAVFFLIGGIMLIVTRLKNRTEQYLKQYGTPIETKFQSVILTKRLEVNGRNPFCILSQWQNPSTSEVHVFKSNNIWYDPTDYIKDRSIIVYIKTNNPKKYFMDLSFLPEVAD